MVQLSGGEKYTPMQVIVWLGEPSEYLLNKNLTDHTG